LQNDTRIEEAEKRKFIDNPTPDSSNQNASNFDFSQNANVRMNNCVKNSTVNYGQNTKYIKMIE